MSSYLSELCRFYDRLSSNPDSGMPPEGMTAEQISFALVIGPDGSLAGVRDMRDSKGRPVRRFVPAVVKRSGNTVVPNFLWDNTGYVLGVDGKGKPARTAKTFAGFRELHESLLGTSASPHARALLAFLRNWKPEDFATHEKTRDIRDALLDSNVVFRLKGEESFLHEAPELRQVWAHALSGGGEEQGQEGICLVTGKPGPIARIHPSIKGVAGAQSSGAALISFNCESFTSYGKEQSVNAPVSETAARAYTSALNYLLRRGNRQSVRIGDTSMVFWADRATPLEKAVTGFFDLEAPDDAASGADQQDMEQVSRIRGILRALRRGESLNQADRELDGGARFFVLGLAPNASRLSVRFWLTATLEVLLRHVARWYADLEIERPYPDSEPEFPPLWLLLVRSLAAQGKSENVPPELAGQLARCLIGGGRFPENVFAALLQRIHADKKVDYFRAALIKAFLCRNYQKEEGIPMQTLNEGEKNIGYRLGRAFALLEKTQKDALGKVNAPLRERYIGAASATPRMVFPVLLRLTQHHVSKASKNGRDTYEVYFNRLMGDILGDMTDFPAILSLADQGRFMLGYFHQTNALYRKKDADAADDDAAAGTNEE